MYQESVCCTESCILSNTFVLESPRSNSTWEVEGRVGTTGPVKTRLQMSKEIVNRTEIGTWT